MKSETVEASTSDISSQLEPEILTKVSPARSTKQEPKTDMGKAPTTNNNKAPMRTADMDGNQYYFQRNGNVTLRSTGQVMGSQMLSLWSIRSAVSDQQRIRKLERNANSRNDIAMSSIPRNHLSMPRQSSPLRQQQQRGLGR